MLKPQRGYVLQPRVAASATLGTRLTPAQPEGLQESSRWSESAKTTGKVHYDPHPGGVPDLTIDINPQISQITQIYLMRNPIADAKALTPLRWFCF